MSSTTPFALLANATGLPWADVPEWPVAEFVAATAQQLVPERGARLCAWFGVPEDGAAAGLFLGCLLFAFFGLTRVVFGIVDGRPRPGARAGGRRFKETAGVVLPPLVLMGLSLWLGLYTPAVLREAWTLAVAQLYPAP